MAFSIDFGYITVTVSEMQNAADAGALSGAKALNSGREAAIASALKWAGKNIDAIEDEDAIIEVDVKIGYWTRIWRRSPSCPKIQRPSPMRSR